MSERSPAQAARDADRERMDALAADMVRRETEIVRAEQVADRLPGSLGPAVLALFDAVKPVRMPDGYLSHPVLGRSSDELVALAAAITAHAYPDGREPWTEDLEEN